MTITSYVYMLAAAIGVVLASLPLIHMLQLESYQGKMYLKWVFKHVVSDVLPYVMIGVIAMAFRCGYVLFYSMGGALYGISYALADIVYLVMLLLQYHAYTKKEHIKPLAFTGRVKRLIAAELILGILFTAAFFYKTTFEEFRMTWFQFLWPNF
ncbi:MAG: hypothetical protein IJB22_08040, partial [Clostridia bacterium]|nr:hypothetical protein [Clostridia bacterium]